VGQFGEEPFDIPDDLSRYKKMRTHGKRLLENGQKISDNICTAALLIKILVYIVELFSVQIIL
jgi:hypothetical protein